MTVLHHQLVDFLKELIGWRIWEIVYSAVLGPAIGLTLNLVPYAGPYLSVTYGFLDAFGVTDPIYRWEPEPTYPVDYGRSFPLYKF